MVLELFLINTQARKALEHSPRTIMPSSSLWEIVASSLTLARSILLRYRAFLSKQIQTSRTLTQFRETASSYHSQYTYSSCKFETGLSLAMEKQNCTPWFLPTDPGREGEVCDPWRAMDFTREMERGEATHCLQDCQGTKYSTQRSSAAFRSENQKSSLLLCCALFPDLVTPRI